MSKYYKLRNFLNINTGVTGVVVHIFASTVNLKLDYFGKLKSQKDKSRESGDGERRLC